MKRVFGICLIGILFSSPLMILSKDLEKTYTDKITHILKRSCYECHGPKKRKGGLNFAKITSYDQVIEDRELWQMVLERVQASEMPPSGSPEMDYGQRQDLMNWLRKLPAPKLDCDQLASDRTQNYYRGYVMSRRLTRYEYQNSINDLFRIQLDIAKSLPADGSGGEGFDTNGSTLFSSPLLVEKYLKASQMSVEAFLDSPHFSSSIDQILNSEENMDADRKAYKIISHFAYRAFRRPVSPDELIKYMRLFSESHSNEQSFEESISIALQGILISPNFLFLVEEESDEPGIHPLSSYELVTRLSYFIWSSLPDDELLALADSGKIKDDEVLESQIERMLKDPRSRALAKRFVSQWLDLESLGIAVIPDSNDFPEFDQDLLDSMRHEIDYFFIDLFQNDRSLLEIISGRHTFLNQRLAKHYGVEDLFAKSNEESGLYKRVQFAKEDARGGLLGMAGIHMATSYPDRTSPVLRGRWILESIIGDKVPPPPPGVPELEEDDKGEVSLSLRKKLELHRTNPECSACHARMDPLGFGLENFDVLGRWRSDIQGQAIDASGTLPSGEKFTGPQELKKVILKKKSKVIDHVIKKMTGYALGRELNRFDDCIIRDARLALNESNYKPSSLVKAIATSFPFRYRFYAIQE